MKFVRLWVPVIAWCCVIFFFSNQPDSGQRQGTWGVTAPKLAHVVEYGILFLLVYRAIPHEADKRAKALGLALVLSILYAASDEYHQTFIGGRTGSPWDVGIDAFGAISAICLLIWWNFRNTKRSHDS